MRIQHNIMAMNAYRNLSNNNNALSGNLEKLSSGYRINRAGDDAAGLAISEKMRAQITGLDVAQDNAQSGINLVQTAEGALTEVHDMLNRMYELAEQSANGTYDDTDRTQLQKEVANLKTEINRIADSANFNGINLLDGNLTAQDLTADGTLQITDKLITDGLEIAAGVNGTGSKGEYVIDLNGKFGTGDTIEITLDDATNTKVTLTYTGAATPGTNEFTGKTVEEQAANIAKLLQDNASIKGKFNVTSDGGKLVITAAEEGASTVGIKSIEVKDKTVSLSSADYTVTNGAISTNATKVTGGWDDAFTNLELNVGDTIRFNFTGLNGEKLTVDIEVTDAMLTNATTSGTAAVIVDALNNAYFNDSEDSKLVDESQWKVKDFFTFTANSSSTGQAMSGGIEVEGTISGALDIGDIELFKKGNDPTVSGATADETVSATSTAGTAGGSVTGSISFGAPTDNFAEGDVFTFTGKLADGRDFTVNLTAGKDFALSGTSQQTLDEIVKTLTTGKDAKGNDIKIQIDGEDQPVELNKIFSTDGANGTIKVTGTTGLTFEANGVGAVGSHSSGITNINFKAAQGASGKFTATKGEMTSAATSSFTLKEGLEYGTAITIGDKTYELVQSEADLSDRRNVAVAVGDITDLKSVADALVSKINSEAATDEDGKALYTAKTEVAEDGVSQKLTITTAAKGGSVEAVKVTTAYGDKQGQLSFQFDADKVKDGSYFELNGQRFEFVAEGSDRKVAEGTIALNLKTDKDGNTTSTDAELAQELYSKIGAAGTATIGEDGKTITIVSKADANGVVNTPKLSFYEGLTLQIGDTSESYNQLNVSIQDCHTNSLGIEDLDISSQTGAKDALNVIKDAINYVSDVRGTLGATQNRLDHTINNLSVMEENIQDAESNIRDTDVAEEMMEYTKNNILIQSAQAMLAQANQVPQGVLQLLG